MSALLQSSHVRYTVIQLSSVKGSPERLVLAYPNEETLRDLIAETSIVGLSLSSRDKAACAAGAAVTKGATPCQAHRVAGTHAEERLAHRLREQLGHRIGASPAAGCSDRPRVERHVRWISQCRCQGAGYRVSAQTRL